MSVVLPIVLLSLIIIGSVAMYQAYQGLFSSFIMFFLTLASAAIAWNYCEPLGWSLGKWHQDYLFFIVLFGGLIVLGGAAKSIMTTNRYVRLMVGIAAIAFLIVVGLQVKMEPGSATGNSYGQGVALVGLFVVSLLCLRAIVDNVVLGKMTFPWQVERVGGGILGFFTGMIIAGVVLITWQLLSFGPGLLSSGYQDFWGLTASEQKKPADVDRRDWARQSQISQAVASPVEDGWASYNRYNEQMELQAAPFPYADGFTLALVKVLSNGSLGGKQSFGEVHPDLLLEAWGNRNGVNFQSRREAPAKSILSAEWKLIDEESPEPGRDPTLRGILSLTLSGEASDEKKSTLRFKGPQVRLVGVSGRSYWPMGIHLENMPWAKLYGDLTALGGNERDNSLQYNKADYQLWGKDKRGSRVIRREIRGRYAGQLWWQLQLLDEDGDFRMLPASFGVVQNIGKEGRATVELIFEIAETDKPDYVVFKRTAMMNVQGEENPAEQTKKTGQE